MHNNIIIKARKASGVVKRTSRGNTRVAMILYKSLVRPNVEYATQVWNPYRKGMVDRIESIQKDPFSNF